MKVYSPLSGRLIDSKIYSAADYLVQLRKKKPMWDVIDEIIRIWIESKPRQWKAHLVQIKAERDTRKNKFASTKDKSLRYMLDIPEKIIMMIRILYTPSEAPMDKEWMKIFAKRYPRFVVAEKL